MNEEYAIEPAALDDIRELRGWLSHFGHAHGRYIAQFPASWRTQVASAFTDDLERKAALHMLKHESNPVANWRTPRGYDEKRSWTENAQRDASAFRDVFAKHPEGPFKALCMASPSDLPSGRDAMLPETANSFVEAAVPLLCTSSAIALVDPYFDLTKRRCFKVLEALVSFCQRRATNLQTIRVFACERTAAPLVVQDVTAALSKLSRPRIEVLLLADEGTLHDRCLVSERGSLKFSRGFQENPGKTTEVHVLDPNGPVHKTYFEQFILERHSFKISNRFSNK